MCLLYANAKAHVVEVTKPGPQIQSSHAMSMLDMCNFAQLSGSQKLHH